MKKINLLLVAAISCLSLVSPVVAQKKSKGEKADKPEPAVEEKKDETKLIDDVVKKARRIPGLFTVYQDTVNGKVFVEIKKSQLGKDYIHFSQVLDAPADAWMFRGAYGWGKIFAINKVFEKIEIVLENTSYYFDPENAVSKASSANINRPVIYSETIAAYSKDKSTYLIEAEKLFIGETFEQIKASPNPTERPGQFFKLGGLSKDKSKFIGLKNYPMNSDFLVELVFEDSYPVNYGHTESLTDPRFVSVKLRNSLIEVPQNDFRPRFDDPRVGYFTDQVTDMTSVEAAPYRDLVHRWYLKKKDPTAAVSEPVEPIVWWIENTTPKDLRGYIREGVLQWNRAFEKAGFKNAIVVKEQPDDADWDAGDIRYNVLRWTSSPRPFFGGYGPSFVNPRTGQILGADVMLEYVFITARLREGELFETAAMDFLQEPGAHADHAGTCTMSQRLHRSMMLGRQVIQAQARGIAEEKKLLEQSLYMLTLHEVGHTLGLNHNMKASHLHDPIKIHDEKIAREVGLTGSVMDYSSVNVALDPAKQGLYYDVVPGPYDVWAIQFGYSEFSPTEEQTKLQELLSKSADQQFLFGNDADDMRAPGRGIDPRVMIDDMSSDPVQYAVERMQLVNKVLPTLKNKFAVPGESYQGLRNAYMVLTSEYAISLRVISRQIGGVYVDRSMVGQPGAGKPFMPVSYQKQKDAMKVLSKYGFSADAMKAPAEIYAMLQSQRRGFNHFGANEDPKLHDRMLMIHRDILEQLMHPNTLQRLIDSELYGNTYKIGEMMTDLTDGIFKEDLMKTVSAQRQNLQTEYVNRLTAMQVATSPYSHAAKAMSYAELVRIKKMCQQSSAPDVGTKAHRQYLIHLIDMVLEVK